MPTTNLTDWLLTENPSLAFADKDALYAAADAPGHEWISCQGIAQVHDVLIQKGIVSDRVLETGESGYLKDLSLCDWIYKTQFCADKPSSRYILRCAGLDTVCDLYVNGVHVGTSESMYLPFRADIRVTLDFVSAAPCWC